MTNLTESGFVTGILERTPQVSPYYDEVKDAVVHLQDGDNSDYPIFELVHGHISALASSDKLSEKDWEIKRVKGGLVVASRDFLNIQDEFASLEYGKATELDWNSELCLKTFEKYLETKKKYRERHISIFQQSLEKVDEEAKKIFLSLANNRFSQLMTTSDAMSLIAVPAWTDNKSLWAEMGLSPNITERIPPWVKIYEVGVILASRLHRNDQPRGHDYFSYAARSVINGEVSEMGEKLWRTAQHEGSHGVLDASLINLLGIDTYNPIGEGIPGSLGEDGRGHKKTKITLRDLLYNPCPDESALKLETSYVAGSRYWDSIVQVL